MKDGAERHIVNIKGPELYKVTSLAYDANAGTVYYTTDNYAFRDLMQVNVATGESKMLIRDGRVGRSGGRSGGSFDLGHSPPERARHAGAQRRRA